MTTSSLAGGQPDRAGRGSEQSAQRAAARRRNPVTQGNIGYHMPGYGWTLNDQQIAELVNTLRASWGNEGVAIKPETVKAQRALHQ